MSILGIVLLIIGGVIFVVSFILPVGQEELSESTRTLAKEEIETLVSKEMEHIRSHVDDVVEESMEYAMEKTERSLERLSNEKIMAVNEYSDTVLQEIHRNHEEVMFLYDMLNDKHNNLKNTVSEVNKTVKEVAETQKEVEETKKEAEVMAWTLQNQGIKDNIPEEAKIALRENEVSETEVPASDSPMKDSDAEGRNSNEKILQLHKMGKSEVAIAKELGIGVGEVKLVIDLYRNM